MWLPVAIGSALEVPVPPSSTLLIPTLKAGSIVSRHPCPPIQATEIILSNGMKVCIKQLEESAEEWACQIFAAGGYATFTEEDYISAAFSPDIVLESGIGPFSGKELSRFLLDSSIDLAVEVQPFQRIIESSFPPSTLESLLALVHFLFVDPHFTSSAMNKVSEQMRDSVKNRKNDCDTIFEDTVLLLNTQKQRLLTPLQEKYLSQLNLTLAEKLFRQCFNDPSQFIFVLVCNASSIDTLLPLLARYLASIPSTSSSTPLSTHQPPYVFPEGMHYQFNCGSQNETLTRLSFPLTIPIKDSDQLNQLEFCTQVMETRFRNNLLKLLGTTQGIDVGYEFPFYPLLDKGWISIQFRAKASLIDEIVQAILQDLNHLKEQGALPSEIESVKNLLQRTERFWSHESSYWVAFLSNFYKWGWNPCRISDIPATINRMSNKELLDFFSMQINIKKYSQITRLNEK